ncbi:hypothetical protein IE00_00895 [Paracoccus sp. SM22M-07]|nr:hypothetical protein IE00_00895 [Paracoccus sp. SM22M-07]
MTMTTVYFSNGTTAEVDNVKGHDPKTFDVPEASYSDVAHAMVQNLKLTFSEGGPVYLFTKLHGMQGTAILEVTRSR